ncbi:hypothetical protein [uncultured Sulfitobacter sp.]|uniref:hypothetical protein n=1 Tax=uncultured Sulfitobacter sp. TaxID=191468 RepID=UPI0025974F8A|nr:hypothetical protein [uncultured Sulfitobacter sp.]
MAKAFWALRSKLVRAAVDKALVRVAPRSIPLTGWERLQGRNYHTVHFGTVEDERVFLADSMLEQGVNGHWWSAEWRYGYPASLPNSNLPIMILKITHYYRELEVEYKGAMRFLLGRLLGWSWIYLMFSRLQRWLYNRKHLVRDAQYHLLRNIYDQTLRSGTYTTSAMDYMTERFGAGWVGHPSNQEIRVYYGLVLEALAEAGDLRRNGRRYSLSPQALSTLADYEQDNRRHFDAIRLQVILIILTFALVMVGLLQAWVTYKSQ